MSNKFTIVIPIYNESKNIIKLIDEIRFNLKNKVDLFEIIIVDDCSEDNSDIIINEYINKNLNFVNIKLISNQINKGQSYSIRFGIEKALNETIVTIDGDGQNDPKDIIKLINFYNENKNISLVGGLRKKEKIIY